MATSFHVAGLCPSASQFLNDDFQRGLARWNRERLSPQMIEPDWADRLVSDQRMLRLEGAFLEELRHEIAAKAAEAPDDAESFLTRSEEHTSELQSLMRISYAVFCLKKKKYRISAQDRELTRQPSRSRTALPMPTHTCYNN